MILVLFFVSGVCGLVHEVVWTRLLRHVMGNDTYAVTTVLAVFMGGLAIGSYVGGRLAARRSDPLRLFAGLEAVVGIYCLLLPTLIVLGEPLYGALYRGTTSTLGFAAIRFLFSALMLITPSILMGATLPILSRHFVRSDAGIGGTAGRLYAINTFGAAVGAASAGFLLLPTLGVTHTIRTAAVVNLLIAVGAFLLHRRHVGAARAEPAATTSATTGSTVETGDAPSPRVRRILLGAYALSGFCALAYEVAWTRALSLLVGSSVYAFSLMLTAFILGLGFGSMLLARFTDRLRDPLRALALLQWGIGLSAFAVVPLFAELPFWVTGLLARTSESFFALQVTTFGLVLLVMLVPTTLMGASFPLVNRIFGRGTTSASRSIGTVYAANTLGSILGACVAGFVLIRTLGIQDTMLVVVGLNVAIGGAILLLAPTIAPAKRGSTVAAAAVVTAAAVLIVPDWDPARISFGPFMQARRLPLNVSGSAGALNDLVRSNKILFHEEGLTTTVTVQESPNGELILLVNGKPDASSVADLATQELLAHIPMHLHPDPMDVLVVGLASGITLASAAKHEAERLDCVELSPAVVRACSYFGEHNDRILDDPRVRIVTADGRNHLALSDRRYDVIISEPSNPWIAGVADLFTEEFFRLCRGALTEQGVVCVWIEVYNIDPDGLKSVCHSFQSVFPNATLWRTLEVDLLLIGGKGEFSVDVTELDRRIASAAVGADLLRIDVESAADLLQHQLMGPVGLARFTAGATPHTDDNALLEFATPRLLVRNVRQFELFDELHAHRSAEYDYLTGDDAEAVAAARAAALAAFERDGRAHAAQIHVMKARAHDAAGRTDAAFEELRKAAAIDPTVDDVAAQLDQGLRLATQLEDAGDARQAIGVYQRLLLIHSDFAVVRNRLARIFATHPDDALRSGAQAVELAERACELTDSEDPRFLDTLAAAYAEARRFADARVTARKALKLARTTNDRALIAELTQHEETIRSGEPVRILPSDSGP